MRDAKIARGFSLIELLIVIAIIAILSSLAFASLNSVRIKSRDSNRISDIKQLQTALSHYYQDNNAYPTAAQFNSSLVPAYLPALPKDPVTNSSYAYSTLGVGVTCSGYHLGAVLEDPGNPSLSADADAAPGARCTGGSVDFNGMSSGCTSAAGTDQCYDVKP
jgi:general secretion pathway protein G